MKIAGVSWWIWLVGIVVVVGGSIIGIDTVERAKTPTAVPVQTRAETRRVPPSARSKKDPDVLRATEEISTQAEVCLRAALDVEGAKYDIKNAEDDLASQRTTGGAQLKAIKLNEAKERHQEKVSKYTGEDSKLTALERQYRSVCDFNYSNRIKVFAAKASLLGARSKSAFLNRGYDDPKSKELWEAWLHVSYKSTIQDLDNSSLFPEYDIWAK
jgi:hypothetical protein